MEGQVEISLLPTAGESWGAQIDQLRTLLGAPNNPHLFPPHYLKTTFPKTGGQIVVFKKEQKPAGVGFLFPRALRAGVREFTLRFHKACQHVDFDAEQLSFEVEKRLGKDRVVFYDPHLEQTCVKSIAWREKDLDIGRPDTEEAQAIRSMQQAVWGSENDFLYPADIHSKSFAAGTSLLARLDEKSVGFLFGFYAFGGRQLPGSWGRKYQGNFRLESQLLGVLPQHRGRKMGFILKEIQAQEARREGIGLVHWTVDPLQYANARLNFGQLKALAFDFYAEYYPFKNELNQMPASRIAITWLVDSERVTRALSSSAGTAVQDLKGDKAIRKFGQDDLPLDEEPRRMAIEIPADWTALQQDHPSCAARWRKSTDRLFQHYLGCEEGKYIITGVGTDTDRKYLIAERVDSTLLETLAA